LTREAAPLKLRHILLLVSAVLAIAFMQPLVSLLGGLTLLLGVGGLIFRDLSPASQDVVERRLLGWLRRVRTHHGATPVAGEQSDARWRLPADPAESGSPAGQLRRGRAKSSSRRPADDNATGENPPPAV
jgi:hypothetical protein